MKQNKYNPDGSEADLTPRRRQYIAMYPPYLNRRYRRIDKAIKRLETRRKAKEERRQHD